MGPGGGVGEIEGWFDGRDGGEASAALEMGNGRMNGSVVTASGRWIEKG